MSALRIEPDLALCIAIFCGSTDLLQRICEIVLHVALRETFQSVTCAKSKKTVTVFLLVCSIFLKCRPAAANATVRSRERELRQAGARRVCFRPCLIGPWVRSPDYESGSRARMSASAEWLVRDQQLAFGLLQLVAPLSSHPLFYRILAWRDSLVFISPAGVRTRARMGLRPLEIESPFSFEKCVKMN